MAEGGVPLAAPSPRCAAGHLPRARPLQPHPPELHCTFQAFPPPFIYTIEESKTQMVKGLAPGQVWGERQREDTQLPVLLFLF